MMLMPLPRSTFLMVLNLAIALIVGAIGFGIGFAQGQLAQTVVLFTVITVAALFWFANYVAVAFENRHAGAADGGEADAAGSLVGVRSVWAANRVLIVAMVLLLLAYLIITATVPPFRTICNLIAFLVLEAILVFAFKVSRVFVHGRSAFIGLIVLIALVVISAFTIDGFLSATNIKAVLLFASFLGIACVGQTLVALMGGLDLSIPFVIGAANIGLLYLVGLGVPPWFAFALVIIIGGLIGFLNGVMSYKLQGQALIMTLGMGFAVAGLVQIITSIGSQFSGNVFGTVPPWLSNLAAMNGVTFRIERAADDSALDHSFHSRHRGSALFRLRPLHLCAWRQSPIRHADRDIGIQVLGSGIHHLRRLCGAYRSAAAGLERRRIHRGR